MAVFAATDYKVTLNGTNFSTSLVNVALELETDEIETTAFGSTWRTRTTGLKSGNITLNFNQDFGAAAVDATIWPLLGSNATVVITPTSSAVSATNPSYTAVAIVSKYAPFNSNVGDLATVSVAWPTTGAVTRGTV